MDFYLSLAQIVGFHALLGLSAYVVLQTGQVAFAIRVPLSLTRTSPLASRFSLHLTQ